MEDLLVNPESWNAVAAGYDDTVRHILTPFSKEAVRWADLDSTDDVLDVAAGPGTTTLLAAREARSVHAIDFAPEMIGLLRKNTSGLTNVSADVGDGQRLDLEDGRFSAAFSMFGLIFFPDPVAGLRELHRVLKPGGRVLISSWPPMAGSPMMQPLVAAIRNALPPDPGQAPPEPFPLHNAESMEQGLREGGFDQVDVQEFAPDIPVVSADRYWSDSRGNIFVNHLRTSMGPRWAETERQIVAHLRESLAGVKSLSMPALIAQGRKSAGVANPESA